MKSFETVHPASAMFYFLFVVVTAMFASNPIVLAEALIGAVCFCTVLERGKGFWKNIAFYVPLFIIISLTNPLFSHNGVTPLFFMNGNPVTKEAIFYGVAIAAMLTAVIIWCKCYSIIMTSDKFLYLFGKIIPKLSLVLSMALRFIPIFKAQIQKVNCSQKAMGLYTSKSFTDRFRSAVRVFFVIISWSLENAIETGDSMRARGYGLKGRTSYSLFRWSRRDVLLLAISASLILAVLTAMALDGAKFYFYPRITGIDLSPLSLLVYIAFGILVFIPFIVELEENLKWTYLISKI